jgi:redox-sensing transcriptional repressor
MNITASQIRQDLNNFGCFGQQGYGYNVESLYNEIKKILGLGRNYNLILVGVGNLGHALVKYENFISSGFNFIALFDSDSQLIGKEVNGLKIMGADSLLSFIEKNQVDIAVLTVTKSKAQEVAEKILGCGVKAIWNFTNKDLQCLEKQGASIENVHLSDSLMTLSYNLNRQ